MLRKMLLKNGKIKKDIDEENMRKKRMKFKMEEERNQIKYEQT